MVSNMKIMNGILGNQGLVCARSGPSSPRKIRRHNCMPPFLHTCVERKKNVFIYSQSEYKDGVNTGSTAYFLSGSTPMMSSLKTSGDGPASTYMTKLSVATGLGKYTVLLITEDDDGSKVPRFR
jgi:hypothetical protein